MVVVAMDAPFYMQDLREDTYTDPWFFGGVELGGGSNASSMDLDEFGS